MVPPTKDLSHAQVWEVKLIKDGQRNFIKSLDTSGGEQKKQYEPMSPVALWWFGVVFLGH